MDLEVGIHQGLALPQVGLICYAELCGEEGGMLTMALAQGISRLQNKRASHCVIIGPIAVCASVSSSVKWEESIGPAQGQRGDGVTKQM